MKSLEMLYAYFKQKPPFFYPVYCGIKNHAHAQ